MIRNAVYSTVRSNVHSSALFRTALDVSLNVNVEVYINASL